MKTVHKLNLIAAALSVALGAVNALPAEAQDVLPHPHGV